MANCMFGFPNRLNGAALSGGSWISTLPLSNLLDRTIGRVARTVGTDPASTYLVIDLGRSTEVRMVAAVNHNLSIYGKWRIRASDDPSFDSWSYDSKVEYVWPEVFPYDELEWEDDRWWSNKYELDDLQGYVFSARHLLPKPILARYWRIELDDQSNDDGFLQIGRVFIGPAWQPQYNFSRNASITIEDKTEVQEAIGGAEYFAERPKFRVTRIALDWLSETEALSRALEMDRLAGISGEIFWIMDPDDTVHAIRRQYLGRFRELSAIEHPYTNAYRKAYEIKELL